MEEEEEEEGLQGWRGVDKVGEFLLDFSRRGRKQRNNDISQKCFTIS